MNGNQIISSMSEFLHISTIQLAEWLNPKLKEISNNWWDDCVIAHLSLLQRDNIDKNKASHLNELDLAALLRIADNNWYLIKEKLYLSNKKKIQKPCINKMLSVRNAWSHIPAQLPGKESIIKDAKVIETFLGQISSDNNCIIAVNQFIDALCKSNTIASQNKEGINKNNKKTNGSLFENNDKRRTLPEDNKGEYAFSFTNEQTGQLCNIIKRKEVGRGGSCLVYCGTLSSTFKDIPFSHDVIIKEFYPIEYEQKGVKRKESGELSIPPSLSSSFDKSVDLFLAGQRKHIQFANHNSDKSLSPMYYAGKANNTYYVISEESKGSVLTDDLRKNYSIVEALELIKSICEDIYPIHKGDINNNIPRQLYLDIKPSNIFIKEDSINGKNINGTRAYLFDFDSVQEYQNIRFCSRSEGWCAPEQTFNKQKTSYKNTRIIGFQTDVFAIANLLVWMLVGKSAVEIGLDKIQSGFDWKSNTTLKDTTDALDDENFILELDGVLEDMLCFDAKERAAIFGTPNAAKDAERYIDYVLRAANDVTAQKRHKEVLNRFNEVESRVLEGTENLNKCVQSVSEQIDEVHIDALVIDEKIDDVSIKAETINQNIQGASNKLDDVNEKVDEVLTLVKEKSTENNRDSDYEEISSIKRFFSKPLAKDTVLDKPPFRNAVAIIILIFALVLCGVVVYKIGSNIINSNDGSINQRTIQSSDDDSNETVNLVSDNIPSPDTMRFVSSESDEDYQTFNEWGDSDGGRKSYTSEEINKGVLDNRIVFNSISDSKVGDERKFVGAKLSSNSDDVFTNDVLLVQDGEIYTICLYIHNDNPNGLDAVAEDVQTTFSLPTTVSKSHTIVGYLDSSNAVPSRIWDTVTLQSDESFYLEYVDDSAKYSNEKMGTINLSVSSFTNGGVPLGYDRFNGKIPGGYQYSGVVTINVKIHKSVDSYLSVTARLKGTKAWLERVDANIGDIVEYQIEYENILDEPVDNVMIRDILPTNVEYIQDSTVIYNSNYPDGVKLSDNTLTTTGINIGSYLSSGNAFVRFSVKIVDRNLSTGKNQLVNWASATVNEGVSKDDASIVVNK